MTFLAISILLINTIFWVIFLVRFKKLFSTDKIIEKTEQTVNNFIKQIDNAADRDTYLAKETSKRIQNMLDEADTKMQLFQEATNRLRDMIAEADKINKGQKYTLKPVVDPDSAYEVKIQNSKPEQGNLFEQSNDTYKPNLAAKPIQKNETVVTPEGAAIHEIPLIITKVYDEQPHKLSDEEKKKRMPELVRKMFSNNETPEEIAQKLNCSITEVQFIIDML
jgi:hypothetical protein